MGLAQVAISSPAGGTGFANGANVNANGTYTGSMNDVLVIYVDAIGNQQKLTPTLTASGGNWSCSFTLPLADWRYMVCARAFNSGDNSTAGDDHAIHCGSPSP
jgi:hypothetical protein